MEIHAILVNTNIVEKYDSKLTGVATLVKDQLLLRNDKTERIYDSNDTLMVSD